MIEHQTGDDHTAMSVRLAAPTRVRYSETADASEQGHACDTGARGRGRAVLVPCWCRVGAVVVVFVTMQVVWNTRDWDHLSTSTAIAIAELQLFSSSDGQKFKFKMATPDLLPIPSHTTQVYKDECVLCFKDPEDTLYVDMRTFYAYCQDHRPPDSTGAGVYLGVKATRVPKLKDDSSAKEAVPEKLAIGVEGGFQVDEKDYELDLAYWVEHDGERIELDEIDDTGSIGTDMKGNIPPNLRAAVEAIKGHDGARTAQTVTEVWEEERQVSVYALDMVQEPSNGKRISPDPQQWRCDETGGDGGGSLWLNLHDGFVGGGRPQWDGSGGNGAAMRHYEEMRKQGKEYPLVVKLGTITPAGADVYSYAADEDDMVLDPELGKHLAHWGISMMQSTKTAKSMAELQIDKNISFEFDLITEAGKGLEVVRARPGLLGLKNLVCI